MNIELRTNYWFELIFEAENVRVTEDIEERVYPKTEDGKTDFRAAPKRDIRTDALNAFARALEDMIHYRKAEFDSSNLIEELFKKLPSEVAIDLAKKMNLEYTPDVE